MMMMMMMLYRMMMMVNQEEMAVLMGVGRLSVEPLRWARQHLMERLVQVGSPQRMPPRSMTST